MIDLNILRTTKQLGLGCSTFGGSTSESTAKISLNSAYDMGIIYFDLARSYGYGQAEAIVGKFARDKRDKIIITSKFGILPPQIPFKTAFIWALRQIKKSIPKTKSTLKQVSTRSLEKPIFTPSLAEKSLTRSLKELKTDYLDIFLFHESTYEDSALDDLRYALEKAKGDGKIRAWGATLSERSCLKKSLQGTNSLEINQYPFGFDNSYNEAIKSQSSIHVVYSILNYIHQFDESINSKVLREAKSKIPLLTFIESISELLLYIAYQELQSGVMLLSMTKAHHIERNISISKKNIFLTIDEIHYLKSIFIKYDLLK